jgi:xanthine/uracil permease
VGGFIVSIPDPVLGGMTTFLFANVLCSGMKILIDGGGGLTRRNRFIVAATFACGSASRLLASLRLPRRIAMLQASADACSLLARMQSE